MLRLLLSLLFLGCHAVVAEPGLPIRGWSSWTQFRCHVNETLVLQMGRAIVDSGLAASGYNYVLHLASCRRILLDEIHNIPYLTNDSSDLRMVAEMGPRSHGLQKKTAN